MDNTAKNDFTQGSVTATILKMAIPVIGAQLINLLYNLVDRMYIGRIPGEGALALTGVGLALPIVTLVAAFASLCNYGGSPLCSIERGRGDLEKAARITGNAFTILIFFAVIITIPLFIFCKPVLMLLGASEVTLPYAADYARIYILGTPFVLVSMGMNGFINSQGFAKIGMMTVAIGAVLNIILDPVFIFALGMGVKGAALATMISQAVSAVWVIRFFTGKKAIIKLSLASMKPHWPVIGRIFALGITGFCMQATTSVVQTVCNVTLQNYGGDLYVGVMTVISAVREMTVLPVRGLGNGAEPVIGYNYGAKAYGRVARGAMVIAGCGLIYSLIYWSAIMFFPDSIIKIFNSDEALLSLGIPSIRRYFSMALFMAFQFAGQNTFVALGRAKFAVFFSLLRKVIITVPLVILLPRINGLGADGVFLAEPISAVVGSIACFSTMLATVYFPMRKLDREQRLAANQK